MTAVHPAASAAPSFRVIIAEGKFHGVRIDLILRQYSIESNNGESAHTRHL
jgi:hypothetical protein